MKKSTKITIAVVLFFVLQALVTGLAFKLPAEEYSFKGTDGYYRKVDICPRKLLDSQKDGMTIGKDSYEEEVLELFQNKTGRGRYYHGSRIASEEDVIYFYDYDKETGALTTYVMVCHPKPLDPKDFKYLGDIARQISEIEVTEETVKEDVLDTLKNTNK